MNMEWQIIVGFLTVFFGILVKIIGFPDQIRKNFQRKSTKGLSTTFFVLAFISYILWTIHGFLKHDAVLVLGQGVGVLTTTVIIYQIFIFRKNK